MASVLRRSLYFAAAELGPPHTSSKAACALLDRLSASPATGLTHHFESRLLAPSSSMSSRRLLLLSILGLSLQLSPLLPHTSISLLSPQLPQFPIRRLRTLDLTALDLTESMLETSTRMQSKFLDVSQSGSRLCLAVADALDVGFRGVQFLVLAGLAWEEDEAGSVCL